MENKIIIVGAGAAGLMAAKILSAKGMNVTVIEAATKTGGRINTIHDEVFDIPLESGAEFIHGNLPLTIGLLQEAHIPFHPVGGKMFSSKNGKWQLAEEPVPHWDDLIDKMNSLETDIPFADFLEQYFGEEKQETLRKDARRYAEGFDLADIHTASTMALVKEWQAEDGEQYRISGGYTSLINYLGEQCTKNNAVIHCSSPVDKISWEKNKVLVSTINGKIFEGNKLIITIPAGQLQKTGEGSISFDPPVDAHKNAANALGYGTVIKIFLQFSKAFWKERDKDLSFVFSNQTVPTWWTQAPAESNLLIGWLGGPNAYALKYSDESIILKLSLESLAAIFPIEQEQLHEMITAYRVFDWSAHEFIEGAYSFEVIGSAAAKKLLKIPVEETIYFAGEAVYEGDSPGTVEAALTTAKEVAALLLTKKPVQY